MARRRVKRIYLKGSPPIWAGEFEGWAINLAKQNGWRVAPDFTFEDIVQECALVFARILERFPRNLDRPQYMAYYKRSCWNRLHDLANIKRKRRLAGLPLGGLMLGEGESGLSPEDVLVSLRALPAEEGLLLAAISSAPEAIKSIIAAAQRGEGGYRIGPSGLRETREELLTRLAGPNAGPGLLDQVRTWFGIELGAKIS